MCVWCGVGVERDRMANLCQMMPFHRCYVGITVIVCYFAKKKKKKNRIREPRSGTLKEEKKIILVYMCVAEHAVWSRMWSIPIASYCYACARVRDLATVSATAAPHFHVLLYIALYYHSECSYVNIFRVALSMPDVQHVLVDCIE